MDFAKFCFWILILWVTIQYQVPLWNGPVAKAMQSVYVYLKMLYVKISNFLDELANGKCFDTGCSKVITLPIRRDRKVVQNVDGNANRDQTKLLEEYFVWQQE